MKCFIASAFGYKDVDDIYDMGVRPVLRQALDKAIDPLRVDRVEHNEDIDKKILALMDSADFCIADLTYARPSTYFEAGYMSGGRKPVIFTCRRDHFRQRDDDPLGAKAVHFDLKMKNIIDWTRCDENFRKRLQARIRLVTRPLLLAVLQTQRHLEVEKAFSRLSELDQILKLKAAFLALFTKLHIRNDKKNDCYYFKRGKHKEYLLFELHQRFRKSHLQALHWRIERIAGKEDLPRKDRKKLWVLGASPNRISGALIRSKFYRYSLEPIGIYSGTVRTEGYGQQPFTTEVRILPLSQIKSVEDFSDRLSQILKED